MLPLLRSSKKDGYPQGLRTFPDFATYSYSI